LAALALLAVALPAGAQIIANQLPPGEVVLPAVWTPSAALNPVPEKWAAGVSWAITATAPGVNTYWYKVDHLGGGPLSPPVQVLKSATVDMLPILINYDNVQSKYLFGQYEVVAPGNGLSWVAQTVQANDSTVRWQYANNGQPWDTLSNGETIYLWVQSAYPGTMVNITLQDGTIGQTKVPAPAPEPMSMALVGLGLSAVAGLRRKA